MRAKNVLNEKESIVLAYATRQKDKTMTIALAGPACFPNANKKGFETESKKESWVRNSLRKLCRLGLMKKIARGTYRRTDKGLPKPEDVKPAVKKAAKPPVKKAAKPAAKPAAKKTVKPASATKARSHKKMPPKAPAEPKEASSAFPEAPVALSGNSASSSV
jgi:hypothetical protein